MPSIVVSNVRTVETHWIPMSDGRRLAARLFLPDEGESNPVPLILEYIPYRRRDGTRTADEEMHMFFAAHGYASARVDIAGTGDSDGLLGGNLGSSAAQSVILMVIVVALTAIQFRYVERKVTY